MNENFFSQFVVQPSDLSTTFPDELSPSRHTAPNWDHGVASLVDFETLFSADLKLSNTDEGLHRQNINRNLSEIADALCLRYDFVHSAALSGHRCGIEWPPGVAVAGCILRRPTAAGAVANGSRAPLTAAVF